MEVGFDPHSGLVGCEALLEQPTGKAGVQIRRPWNRKLKFAIDVTHHTSEVGFD